MGETINHREIWLLSLLNLSITAMATNPDEKSFEKYLDVCLQKDGYGWLQRQMTSSIVSSLYQYHNLGLFSLVTIAGGEERFLGIFGHWFKLPFLGTSHDI